MIASISFNLLPFTAHAGHTSTNPADPHIGARVVPGTPRYALIQQAITSLEQQSAGLPSPLKELFEKVGKGLGRLLKIGAIDVELHPAANAGAWASTLQDESPEIVADRINVNPTLLGPTPRHQAALKAVLFHEALHGLGLSEAQHRLFYPLELFVLDLKGLSPSHWFYQQTVAKLVALGGPPAIQSQGPRSTADGRHQTLYPNDARIHLIDPSDFEEFGSLPSGFARPLDVLMVGPIGSQGLVVSGCDDNGTGGGIALLRDLDADGWVDLAGFSWIVLPGAMAIPASVASDSLGGDVFILDVASHRIFRLIDSDADGLPDGMASAPWASAVDFPALADTRRIECTGHGVIGLHSAPDGEDDLIGWRDTDSVLIDDNLDGRADRLASVPTCAGLPTFTPATWPDPVGGDTNVGVVAPPGSQVVVRALLDSSPGPVLGLVAVDPCDFQGSVPLGRAIVAGESLRVSTSAGAETVAVTAVTGPKAQVMMIEPQFVHEGSLVLVTGRFFPVNPTCEVGGVPCSIVSSTPNAIRLLVPPRPSGAFGSVATLDLLTTGSDAVGGALVYEAPLVVPLLSERGLILLGGVLIAMSMVVLWSRGLQMQKAGGSEGK